MFSPDGRYVAKMNWPIESGIPVRGQGGLVISNDDPTTGEAFLQRIQLIYWAGCGTVPWSFMIWLLAGR